MGIFLLGCFKSPKVVANLLESDLEVKTGIPVGNLVLDVMLKVYGKDVQGYTYTAPDMPDMDLQNSDYMKGFTVTKDTNKIRYYFPYFASDPTNTYIGKPGCLGGYNVITHQRLPQIICRNLSSDYPQEIPYLNISTPFGELIFFIFLGGKDIETSTEYFPLVPIHTLINRSL